MNIIRDFLGLAKSAFNNDFEKETLLMKKFFYATDIAGIDFENSEIAYDNISDLMRHLRFSYERKKEIIGTISQSLLIGNISKEQARSLYPILPSSTIMRNKYLGMHYRDLVIYQMEGKLSAIDYINYYATFGNKS